MNSLSPQRKIRKGTKSCIECRKRKIRCVWLSDNARACRRCEERSCPCLAQTTSTASTSAVTWTSKTRIARLEQQVTNLTTALHNIEAKLGHDLSQTDVFTNPGGENVDSDSESNASENFTPNGPAYLQSLFNNDTISSDNREAGNPKPTLSSQIPLLAKARERLQALLPSREDTSIILDFADPWLNMYQAMFDMGSAKLTRQSIAAEYDGMSSHEANPVKLAGWLVVIAITALQTPGEGVKVLSSYRSLLQYCRILVDTVEQVIFTNESLLCTVEGVQTAIHTVRLQLSLGNFTRMWLLMRRAIAASELIGLPQSSRTLGASRNTPSKTSGTTQRVVGPEEQRRIMKGDTWAVLCAVDRMAGMLMNLPAGTKRYQSPKEDIMTPEGAVNTRVYLRMLVDIAMDGHDLNDSSVAVGTDADLYAQALELDRRLKTLSSTVPREWWGQAPNTFSPVVILQFWHHYVRLRTHLPFTLRQTDSHLYYYSQHNCLDACQVLLHQYPSLRRAMPQGFFAIRVMDLQILTAAVVYLLTYHKIHLDRNSILHHQSIEQPESLIPHVIEAMEQTVRQHGSNFAKNAISTIRSLSALLNDDNTGNTGQGTSRERGIVLKVPLMGKIHVRKAKQNAQSTVRSQGHVSQQFLHPLHQQPVNIDPYDHPSLASDPSLAVSDVTDQIMTSDNSWMWDPFSYSIEDDRESMFQDTFVLEKDGSFDFIGAFNMIT